MVELQLPKLVTRVRFPSPALGVRRRIHRQGADLQFVDFAVLEGCPVQRVGGLVGLLVS